MRLVTWLVTNAIALAVAAWLFEGIWFSGPTHGQAEIEEKDEESTDDEKEYDMMNSVVQNTVPTISVGEHEESGVTDLMSDVDKSVEYRVRTLYGYEGEGADDLCEFFSAHLSFRLLKQGISSFPRERHSHR